MRRREFIALAGAAACIGPIAAGAQQAGRTYRIGFLASSESMPIRDSKRIVAFRERLRELGYVEGRDIVFEMRTAEGRVDRMPALARELASLKPDVVVAGTTTAAIALKNANASIPIVAVLLSDPIGFGLAASHARPGGNVTGNLITLDTLPGKHLELARDLLVNSQRVGMLVNARNPTNAVHRRNAERVAATADMVVVPAELRTPEELESAFHTLVRARVDAVLVPPDTMFFTHKERIAALALAARLPSIYAWRDHVEAGGLASYGVHMNENFRRAADFVDKILRGAKPADLPIELQTKFELIVNLKTAKALGITVPPTMLGRADEVIE